MKIGLVNLCSIDDFAKTKHARAAFDFLKHYGIEYVDYVSGRGTFSRLLDGFHRALKDPSIDLIWFIKGGEDCIRFLPYIDWRLVRSAKKQYLGLSDFTHFVFPAVKLGQTCFYGPSLKKIDEYLPTEQRRRPIVNFLKYGIVPPRNMKLLKRGASTLSGNPDTVRVVGGHLLLSTLLQLKYRVDLRNRFLFLEHHYIPGETLQELLYFVDALKMAIEKNMPKGIILGRSVLYTSPIGDKVIPIQKINAAIVPRLQELGIPIYYFDHFASIIRFS